MSTRILSGDVFDTLPTIEPGSIDCAVSSPPYWQLRSYLPKDHPLKKRELGSEKTPAEFVANMVRVFGLVRDTLADHGTCWVNIGDSYAAGGRSGGYRGENKGGNKAAERNGEDRPGGDLEQGNLCLIPQRLMIALQDDGWIIRSQVIWCLSPSTRVYAKTQTTEGPATLHDLVRLAPSTVKLWNGNKWTQVRGWSSTPCESPLSITLRSGERINTTPNHKWPLSDGRVVQAAELNVGDVLATCTLPEPEFRGGDGIDADLAWFAGLFMAEGCVDDHCIRIAGNANETERHDRVWRLVLKFGGSSSLRADDGDSVTQTIYGDIIRGALDHFISGKGAHGKHLHPRCWSLSNTLLRAFLEGYLSGDGHRDPKNDRWRLGFCRNDAWAADLRTLSARLGATITLNPCYSKMGPKAFEAYRGELRFSRSGHHSERERSEIVVIGKATPGEFIDVGVADEPHLFALASGVLTHNSKPACMPASLSGWQWRRCRVKQSIGGKSNGKQGEHPSRTVASLNANANGEGAKWADCPGCRKCKPAGGYVLRRGSWRPTSSYEPVIMLAKSEKYFADGEPVKTPPKDATVSRDKYTRVLDDAEEQFAVRHDHETECVDGANLRDVWRPDLAAMSKEELISLIEGEGGLTDTWRIASQPLREKHYAAFPEKLVDTILRCSTSAKGYCPACGKPWVRMLESVDTGKRQKKGDNWDTGEGAHGSFHRNGSEEGERDQPVMANRTVGWRASCEHHDLEPRPGRVLDPFGGSGRTAIAAQRLGLDAVLCELNPEYVEMSRRLIHGESPLFAGVEAA